MEINILIIYMKCGNNALCSKLILNYITLHYIISYYINYADDNCRLTSVNYNLHSKQLYFREFHVHNSFTTLKLYLSN